MYLLSSSNHNVDKKIALVKLFISYEAVEGNIQIALKNLTHVFLNKRVLDNKQELC